MVPQKVDSQNCTLSKNIFSKLLPQIYFFKIASSKNIFSKLPSQKIHFQNCFLKNTFLKVLS